MQTNIGKAMNDELLWGEAQTARLISLFILVCGTLNLSLRFFSFAYLHNSTLSFALLSSRHTTRVTVSTQILFVVLFAY